VHGLLLWKRDLVEALLDEVFDGLVVAGLVSGVVNKGAPGNDADERPEKKGGGGVASHW